jgi:hydroxysqualene dehydroxylase
LNPEARVHVVGAGLAGLAAATRLAACGMAVEVHEMAASAGGRCRSFVDPALGCTIDNGNHLLLSGNTAALGYLARIGAAGSLTGPEHAAFDFVDLASGERWQVRPNRGRVPYWLLRPDRRVAGTRALDYLALRHLLDPPAWATVGDVVDPASTLYRRFIEPLAVATLNTPAADASARLFAAVLCQAVLAGAAACRPLVAQDSLAASFVTPAVGWLEARGVPVQTNRRLRRLVERDGRVKALDFGAHERRLGPLDSVVLALPATAAVDLAPWLKAPTAHSAILNIHYRLDRPAPASPLLGLVGGFAEWLFRRGDVVSVTVSAADAHVEAPAEGLAARAWADVGRALRIDAPMPRRFRVIKERRATFRQTPASLRQRPAAQTRLANLLLAGDWTDTGLPATIEGAVRSGEHAAALILSDMEGRAGFRSASAEGMAAAGRRWGSE